MNTTTTTTAEQPSRTDAPSPAKNLHMVAPWDEHNQRWASYVHPDDWENPRPDGRYNLLVIGAGPAGLVAAAGAAGLGARVALVEKQLLGGDCLNVGCVPSKALLAAGHAAAAVRAAADFGVRVPDGTTVDFPAAMERLRRLRADLSHHDAASRFRDLGVDVYLGEGRFTGRDTFEIDGRTLQFSKACVATGARAMLPPIPGLDQVGALTNETVFTLTELPQRLAVVGAGPIGAELSQAFARLGAEVTLLEMSGQVLPREDADAAAIVAEALRRDGVHIRCQTKASSVSTDGDEKVLQLETSDGHKEELRADAILIGVGRKPNVENLGLDAAGVQFDERSGIQVDDHLRTSNKHIYAAGDVCSVYKFTHSADAMARIVIQNALFFGRGKVSRLNIPWCTYTDPALAHIGLYEPQAKDRGIEVNTFRIDLDQVDRAVLDGESNGFVKVHAKAGSDRILGATIVARNAGDMIAQISQAMTSGLGLGKIAATIFPYPTQAEAIKKAADAYNRTRLTPTVKKLFERILAWRR